MTLTSRASALEEVVAGILARALELRRQPTNFGLSALKRERCKVGPKYASWPVHSGENTATNEYERLKLAQLLGQLGVSLT
jgi:hypothetical protein